MMIKGKKGKGHPGVSLRPIALAVALSGVACVNSAWAFEFDTGNPDMNVRWDNTVRYNYMRRVESQNPTLLANPNLDDGDRNFSKGTVSNRVDLLSEFDLVYRKNHGVRISGSAWYDDAYKGGFDNNSVATSNHLENGVPAVGLSPYAKRYYKGPSGEILDAFMFTKFDLGSVPINLKLGRHTVFWGEGLQLGGTIHGISYMQSPLDAAKGFTVPGVEVKELFRPLTQISAQAQVTPELSIAGQYFVDWEPIRFPEAGTFLGASDLLLWGGESLVAVPGVPGVRFLRGNDIRPKKKGEWGLSTRWRPEWLDGTLGIYYRNLSDKIPQAFLAPAIGQYGLAYAQDIRLLGVSLSKQIAGVSVGAELSHRENMPLVSDLVVILPPAALPANGQTPGARGNTTHGVLNFLGTINNTPLFDSASWLVEFTWSRWDKVTQGETVFKGRSGYTALDAVSKSATQVAFSFTPTWFQVFPSVDMTLPINYSVGLDGNAATAFGGNKDSGTYSAGIGLDFYQKYKFDLKYVGFFGPTTVNAAGVATVAPGNAPLKDRGFLALTFKTTF